MRLNEFADPKEYTPIATDADDFLSQLLLIWSDRSADELAASVLGGRKQRPIKRTKLSDALSIGRHVSGSDLRSRRGASQWPTA
jgi:hypothetical protein